MQEASDEGETEVDEEIEKVIKRRNSYNIPFQEGVSILYGNMK